MACGLESYGSGLGHDCGFLANKVVNLGVHKLWETVSLAKETLTSEEGLSYPPLNLSVCETDHYGLTKPVVLHYNFICYIIKQHATNVNLLETFLHNSIA